MHRSLVSTTGVAGAYLLLLAALPAVALAAEPPHEDREVREEILVTARPIPKSTDELAVPVNLVDRDHLIAHLGSTLGETLRREPGITTTGFAPGASRPVVRGQDAFRVRILDNGLGTAGVSAISADHGVPINPLSARQVEVLRGPATLRYGGGAIAGAVNVLTDRVPRAPVEAPVTGEAFAGYGSVAEQGDFAGLLEGGAGPVSWHLDGLSRQSKDYGLPGTSAVQDNTDARTWSAAAGGAWIGSRGRLGFGAHHFANDYGISEPENPADAPSIELESQSYDLEGDLSLDRGALSELRLRGRFTDYAHDEVVRGQPVSKFRAETWEARAELLHGAFFGPDGAVGVHGLARDLEARGEGAELLAPTETRMFAGYLFEDVSLGAGVTLELGARAEGTTVEGRQSDGRSRRRTFRPLSGSLGVLADLGGGLAAGLTLSGSQRAPDALELFAMGPHEADETFQIGDPGADEETSWTAELLLRGELPFASFEASGFATWYEGFLFGRLTGNTRDEDGTFYPFPDDSGELRELVYTQEDALFLGFELAGRVPLTELALGELGLDAQVDYVRARLDRGGNVPRIPPLRWGGGLYLAGERLRARVGFLRNEAQHRTGDFETSTSGYTMLDASASVALLERAGRGVSLEIALDNLTDARARNHVSFKKDDQRLPGRSVRVGLRGSF
jgi:iron complex outermembrane receptor protein